MSLRKRLTSIKEKVVDAVSSGASWVASPGVGFWRKEEEAEIDRKDYMETYRDNLMVRASVDMTVANLVGGGFFTGADNEEVKQIVDEFCERVGQDRINQLVARDALVTGDGIIEKIYDKEYKKELDGKEVITPKKNARFIGVKWAPSFTFTVKQSPTGKVKWWKQKWERSKKYFDPKKIINIKWNPTGLDAYGTSEVRQVHELIDDLKKIRKNFVKITKRYASPPIIWKCKGMSEERRKALKKSVEEKGQDEDIYLNTDLVEAEVLEIDPKGKFENYYKVLQQAAVLGLQTPTIPILSEATLASSEAMLEFYARKIESGRRLIKRMIEREIFSELIEQAGKEEVPKVRWNKMPIRLEGTIPGIALDLFDRNIYSPSQTEKMLKKSGVPFPPKSEEEKRVKSIEPEEGEDVGYERD